MRCMGIIPIIVYILNYNGRSINAYSTVLEAIKETVSNQSEVTSAHQTHLVAFKGIK